MATGDIKQFGDAARKARDVGDEDDTLTVKILDRDVTLHSPGSGSLAYLAMSIAGAGNDLVQLGQVINFIMSIFDEDDARYTRGLLLDRDSGFDAEDIMDLAIYVVEEWSSRPYESVYWLIGAAAYDWGTWDGRYAKSNIDAFSFPFVRFVNLIYATFYDIVVNDEKALLDFETKLAMPVPGVQRRVNSAVVEDEMALFRQSTGATG